MKLSAIDGLPPPSESRKAFDEEVASPIDRETLSNRIGAYDGIFNTWLNPVRRVHIEGRGIERVKPEECDGAYECRLK